MAKRNEIVKSAIEGLLAESSSFAPRELVERTGLSRQALHAHLSRALDEGRLERVGEGRAARYRLPRRSLLRRSFATAGLDESGVWLELRSALHERVRERGRGVDETLAYAVTEIVNNAVEHSTAPEVALEAAVEGTSIVVRVEDAGIGAFASVRDRLGLDDCLHALQAISKGKTTTDPEHHSGEGLFFSSKAVDRFELHANGLAWIVDNELPDQAVLEDPLAAGTRVDLELAVASGRSLQALFEQYTTDVAFDRTRAVVRLFEHGTRFVSRSEAERLAAGLERFREVELDFTSVQGIGQGFADELFRVWAAAHPDTRLLPGNMNRAVAFMVERVRSSLS